jgi:hypothetical protein
MFVDVASSKGPAAVRYAQNPARHLRNRRPFDAVDLNVDGTASRALSDTRNAEEATRPSSRLEAEGESKIPRLQDYFRLLLNS